MNPTHPAAPSAATTAGTPLGRGIPASRPGSSGAGCWGAAGMPQEAPTCTAARSEPRAAPGRAGARGPRGAGPRGRGAHGAGPAALLRGAGPGGIHSARLPPLRHRAEDPAGPRRRRRRQQQARGRGGCGGGGGGVCARLAFPPPRLGERGGGEGRAEAGIS